MEQSGAYAVPQGGFEIIEAAHGSGYSLRSSQTSASQNSLASSVNSVSSRMSLRQRSVAAVKNARNVLNRKCSLKQNKTHREPEYRRSQGQGAKTRVNPEPSHPPLTTQWYTRPADPLAFHPKISALRKRLKPYARNLDTNNDIAKVPEYAFIGMEYTRAREGQFVCKDYLPNQIHMNASMRRTLVDWMAEMQDHWQLGHTTFYASIRLVDLFLSLKENCPKNELQLLGATTLFMASKFHERYVPGLAEMVEICQNCYTEANFVEMEKTIFSALDFDINVPTAYCYTRRFADVINFDIKELTLARFVLELTVLDYHCVPLPPSAIAAASIFWTMIYLGKGDWTPDLQYHTAYSKNQLVAIVYRLTDLVKEFAIRRKSGNIYDKYESQEFFQVARIIPERLALVQRPPNFANRPLSRMDLG